MCVCMNMKWMFDQTKARLNNFFILFFFSSPPIQHSSKEQPQCHQKCGRIKELKRIITFFFCSPEYIWRHYGNKTATEMDPTVTSLILHTRAQWCYMCFINYLSHYVGIISNWWVFSYRWINWENFKMGIFACKILLKLFHA